MHFPQALLDMVLYIFQEYLFSKEPALTPILIEQLFVIAALKTSLIFFSSPILPGLIRKQSAPFSAASIALW